jgi:spore maturation protein CgeB
MRLLLVHPGADYSTADVFHGLAEALARAGHAVGVYALNGHLELAARYLALQQARLRRMDPNEPRRLGVEATMSKASEGALLVALRGRADAVLIVSALFFHPSALFLLRAARMPVGLLFTESPYQDEEQADYAALASVCWTNDRGSVERLRRANARTHYLPAAYRAGVHCPGRPPADVPRHDALFIGTLFRERAELLAAVDWTGIDLGIYGSFDAIDRRSALYRRLAPHVRGGVMDNARAIQLYRAAKIVLNPYRTSVFHGSDAHVEGESLNPRAYELAACGAFQLSSDRPEIRAVFGEDVPTFRDAEEMADLVRAFVNQPDLRAHMAASARRRIAGATFDARARQLAEQLEGALLRNPFAAPGAAVAAD